MTIEEKSDFISWQGFRLPLMREWRPLRIEGGFRKGSVAIGDISNPLFEIRWLRPESADFDGQGWIDVNRTKAEKCDTSSPPRPAGFSSVGWIRGFEDEKKNSGGKTVWWGYSSEGRMLIEMIVSELVDSPSYRWIVSEAIPRLKVLSPADGWTWRIFSAQFSPPPGFVLEKHRLNNGDISLCFTRGKSERLLLRQVYPAELALGRRMLGKWFDNPPFRETRRFRAAKDGEKSADNGFFRMDGWKLIPFPIGFIMPRRCRRAALLDVETDRIFMAEYEYGKNDSAEIAEMAVKAMCGGVQ
jgi:hypothetical protein